MTRRFVVVGGGLTGMFSALLLARFGFAVTLLEKGPRLGPVVRGFQAGGCRFETGLHYTGGLDEAGVLRRLFRFLGIGDELAVRPFDPECFDRVRELATGEEFAFPTGERRLAAALKERFPAEAEGIERYLALVAGICAELPFVRAGNGTAAGPLFAAYGRRSLAEVLGGLVRDPLLRGWLAMHGLLYGAEPEQVSFAFHATNAGFFYRSVHALRDGGAGLVRLLETRLAAAGVDVRCGWGVKQLLVSPGGEFSGVESDTGAWLAGDGCVVTVHPRIFLDLLPEGAVRPGYRRRIVALPETSSALMLFGSFAAPDSRLAAGNLFLMRGAGPVETPLERTLYLTGAERCEPDGRHGCMVLQPLAVSPGSRGAALLALEGEAYRKRKKQLEDELLEQVRSGAPEIGNGLEVVATATPKTFSRYANSPVGSLYGAMHHLEQTGLAPRTRIRNLLLAGQGVTAPGLLGTAMSAFLCCGEIVGQERLQSEVAAC